MIAHDLQSRGHNMEIVSSGSTPGARYTLEVDGITEIRPGNYVFYDTMQVALGTTDLDHCALSVVTTVVSHQESGRAVIDAGAKALALDKGLGIAARGHGWVMGYPGIVVEKLSEEHGWLTLDEREKRADRRQAGSDPQPCVRGNQPVQRGGSDARRQSG